MSKLISLNERWVNDLQLPGITCVCGDSHTSSMSRTDFSSLTGANLLSCSTWRIWISRLRYWHLRGRTRFGHSNSLAEEGEEHAHHCGRRPA